MELEGFPEHSQLVHCAALHHPSCGSTEAPLGTLKDKSKKEQFPGHLTVLFCWVAVARPSYGASSQENRKAGVELQPGAGRGSVTAACTLRLVGCLD